MIDPCARILRRVGRRVRRAIWHHSHHPIRKAAVVTAGACGASGVEQFVRGGVHLFHPLPTAPLGPPSAHECTGQGALAPQPDWYGVSGGQGAPSWDAGVGLIGIGGEVAVPPHFPADHPDLVSVPEPSSFWLVLLATGTALLVRKWRSR